VHLASECVWSAISLHIYQLAQAKLPLLWGGVFVLQRVTKCRRAKAGATDQMFHGFNARSLHPACRKRQTSDHLSARLDAHCNGSKLTHKRRSALRAPPRSHNVRKVTTRIVCPSRPGRGRVVCLCGRPHVLTCHFFARCDRHEGWPISGFPVGCCFVVVWCRYLQYWPSRTSERPARCEHC
jgi:hypothetical protein